MRTFVLSLALLLAACSVLVSQTACAPPSYATYDRDELLTLARGRVSCAEADYHAVRPTQDYVYVHCRDGEIWECTDRRGYGTCRLVGREAAHVAAASAEPVQSISDVRTADAASYAAVRRTRTESGWALDVDVPMSGATLSLHAVPEQDAQRVWWSVLIPTSTETTCASRALIDGAAVDIAVESRHPTSGGEVVRGLVPVTLLAGVLSGSRVIGHTCGHEWVFPLESARLVRAFLDRMYEEAALHGPRATTAQ